MLVSNGNDYRKAIASKNPISDTNHLRKLNPARITLHQLLLSGRQKLFRLFLPLYTINYKGNSLMAVEEVPIFVVKSEPALE